MSLLTIVGIVLIYSLIISTSNRRLRNNSKLVFFTNKQYKELDEGFSSFKEIILENKQDYKSNIYRKLDKKMRSKIAQSLFIRSFPRYAIEAIVISFIIVLAYLDFQRGQDGSFITNLVIIACQRALPYGQIMFQSWAYVRANSSDLEKTLDLTLKKLNYLKNLKNNFSFKEKLNLKI